MNDILSCDPAEIETFNPKLFSDLLSIGAIIPEDFNELQEVIEDIEEDLEGDEKEELARDKALMDTIKETLIEV